MTTQPECDTCHKPLSVAQAVVMVVAGATNLRALPGLYPVPAGGRRQRQRLGGPALEDEGRDPLKITVKIKRKEASR